MRSAGFSLGLLVVVSACHGTSNVAPASDGGTNNTTPPTTTTDPTPTWDGGTQTQTGSDGGALPPDPPAPTTFTGTAIRPNDTDNGAADPTETFRTLFNLQWLGVNGLTAVVQDLYTPGSANFRKYLSKDAVAATYLPPQATVDAVSAWITSNGMKVERVATNRMLIQVSGTIGAFNTAFGVTVHDVTRGSSTVFGTPGDSVPIPTALAGKLTGVLTLDVPAVSGNPDTTGIPVDTTPPGSGNATLADARTLFAADGLPAQGAGETIVVVGAGAVRNTDMQSFWQSQGVTRNDLTINMVAEAPKSVNSEATLDLQWAGGMAPGAALIFYQAPDITDSALVFAFNEAVGKGEATVITDSFSHHETVVPAEVLFQYDRSALAAAAQGITILSSSGDSSEVNSPSSSPYVLAIGGITKDQDAWDGSGGGQSATEPLPDWQKNVVTGGTNRATPDIAALAEDLWFYTEGYNNGSGTSFASPLTAGLFATLNSVRTKAGQPRIGWLNSILYTTPAVQAAFVDIVTGTSGDQSATTGWDFTTGWGAPNLTKLATAIP